MPEQVRIGVVGTSWFADGFHLPSLASHPKAKVEAICGRNRERADELARKYTIPCVYTDYHEMIASGMLDALVVVTPDALHYPITIAALDAGLHVLCEKPLALDAAQAREMYEQAEAARRKHMVMFTWRGVAQFRYVRQLIEQGYIGRCYHCHVRYEGGYGRGPSYGWRFNRHEGNGILGDLGAHMIDLARWYVGDIAKVSGHLATFVEREGPDGAPLDPANDSALVAMEFANGAQGSIHVSAVAHVGDRDQVFQVAIYGEAGSLELDFAHTGAELRALREGEEQWQTLVVPAELREPEIQSPPLDAQYLAPYMTQSVGPRHFVDAILDDRPVSPSFYEGWKAQEVIDAATASHAQARWIALPTPQGA